MGTNKRILVLGLGNDILSDDRIGIQLTSDIEREMKDDSICFRISSSGGLQIVELIREFDEAIIIDAIKTRNGIPGDVSCFTPDNYKQTLHLAGLHDIDFFTAIELFSGVTSELAVNLHIIAIEIAEDMVFSNEFTPVIRARYEEIKERVIGLLKRILKN